MAIFKLGKG
jgi:CRP-like cAMP-binding protein